MNLQNPQLRIQGATIVVRGQFNPAIFHPAWFEKYNLVRSHEAEEAKIEVIHPDASVFQMDWLQVRIIRDRFLIGTVQEPFEALRDIGIGIFDLLEYTPVRLLGINREFHFDMVSKAGWHLVGDTIAPKDIWVNILEKPGLMNLTMQADRNDQYEGYIQVRIAPSDRFQYGIFIEVNDHYQLSDQVTENIETPLITDILKNEWVSSSHRSLKIAGQIIERFGKK